MEAVVRAGDIRASITRELWRNGALSTLENVARRRIVATKNTLTTPPGKRGIQGDGP
jgi:hypothetical protein